VNILKLRLVNFRGVPERFVEPKQTGVTVISAPNETGKSSLIEGLDLILTELDSSKKRSVLLVKPIGRDVGPEVEIEIRAPPYHFILRKRWAKHPITELHIIEPRAEAISGREAHERVDAILSETSDLDLFRALQVLQGEGLQQPALAGKALLTRALDEAAGRTAATEGDTSLAKAVEEEYGLYFTHGGDVRQAVKERREEAAGLGTRVTELQEKVRFAEAEVETHARLKRELSSVDERLVSQKNELQGWEGRLAEVSRLQDAQRVVAAEARAAEEGEQRVFAALAARSRLSEEIRAQGDAIVRAKAEAHEAGQEIQRLKQAYDRTADRVQVGEGKLNGAKTLATIRGNDRDRLRLQFDIRLLSERLVVAEGSQREFREAEEALRHNKVTNQALDQLRELQTAETVARGKLETSSPTLAITATADIRPIIDGRTVPLKKGSKHEATVTDRSIVELQSGAKIEFRAGTSLTLLHTKHKEALEQLQSAFQKAGVGDMPGAVGANRALEESQNRKREAQRALRQALRTDYPEPFANVEELAAKVTELKGRLVPLERDRPADPPMPKTREEAEQLARGAGEAFVILERELKALQEEASRVQQDLQARTLRAARVNATVDEMNRMLSVQNSQLDKDRQSASDEELASQAEAAKLEFEQKRNRLAEADKRLAAADPDSVQTRTESLRAAVKQSQEAAVVKQSKLAEASGRLSRIAEEGIYDQLEAYRRAQEFKTRELESEERRARAAQLLFEVLSQHRSEAQRAYVGPLRGRIEDLGRLVYGPTLKVELAEDLSIVSREIDTLPIPFESLSKGAQEQLGIIVRLAVAMIVSKKGEGVPVIIDDALGFTDPDRLLAMGAVLDRAGRECQVIVLTCQPDRYAAVGAATVIDFAT
jgi:hypothetical protein